MKALNYVPQDKQLLFHSTGAFLFRNVAPLAMTEKMVEDYLSLKREEFIDEVSFGGKRGGRKICWCRW